MKYFFPFLVITSQLQKIKIDEKLNRASINELFSREPQIFTQSNGQKSLSGLMSSNNRKVLKWCINYSKIMPPYQQIFGCLMRKIPIGRKSFSQCNPGAILMLKMGSVENKIKIFGFKSKLDFCTYSSRPLLRLICLFAFIVV